MAYGTIKQSSQGVFDKVANQVIHEEIALIEEKAQNLYDTCQLYCSEAVLAALNSGFNGGLTEKQAINISSAMPVGIGDNGCLCGAVNGGLIALGLLLGEHVSRKEIREAASLLYEKFQEIYSSTCCRVLTREVKGKNPEHFRHCSEITRNTAGITAEVLLEYRPDLIYCVNISYLKKKDSKVKGLIKKVVSKLA